MVLAFILAMSSSWTVFAETSENVTVTVGIHVYVDDAFIFVAEYYYWYPWKDLAYIIVSMGVYGFYENFKIDMKIASYNIWNPPTLNVYNLISMMYYSLSNQQLDTEPKEIFLSLTGGDLYRPIGQDREYGVRGAAPPADEWYWGCVAAEISVRTVQHEISHLYGPLDHEEPVECVMYAPCESEDWCQPCKDTIWGNKFRFGFIIKQYSGAIPLAKDVEQEV